MPAIAEVLQGNQFVTASLRGLRHEVEFYPDDAGLIDGFARLMKAALKVGNAVVVIRDRAAPGSYSSEAEARYVDVDAVLKQGRFIPLDARETLSKIMVADLPDPVRCATLVGDLLREKAGKRPKAQKGNILELQFAENVHPHCWQKATLRQRSGSNDLWDEITRRYDADTLLWVPLECCSAPRKQPHF